MACVVPRTHAPQIGDLVVAEVLQLGRHTTIETRSGVVLHLFPGDRIVGAFGNRYATDQYEGYLPQQPEDACDLLSVGGLCGEVVSRHDKMVDPTRLRLLGAVGGPDRQPLNLRTFALPLCPGSGDGKLILVVGASMNAGKTTTVGTLARALRQAGRRVAAAKVTGTAAGKDGRYFISCGAHPVLDFTAAGYPSTYLLDLPELMRIHRTLVGHLQEQQPDYIIVELADGIFQRETRMLLDHEGFRAGVDHVFFAAGDSLAVECGVRCLRDYGLPVRATAGAITQSPLGMREAEAATGIPCLSIERMLAGEVLEILRDSRAAHPATAPSQGVEATGTIKQPLAAWTATS